MKRRQRFPIEAHYVATIDGVQVRQAVTVLEIFGRRARVVSDLPIELGGRTAVPPGVSALIRVDHIREAPTP